MIYLCVADALPTDAFWMMVNRALWGIFLTQCLMAKWGSVHEETLVSEEQPTRLSLAMNLITSDCVF